MRRTEINPRSYLLLDAPLMSQSSSAPPVSKLTQVIGKMTGQNVREELAQRWKIFPGRLKWIGCLKSRSFCPKKGIREIGINLQKNSSQLSHRWIGRCLRTCLGSGAEQVSPFPGTNRFAPTQSPRKISGDTQVADQPSGGLVAGLRLHSGVCVLQALKHGACNCKEVSALSGNYIHAHFVTRRPASSATAPSVVCAAFRPNRKSLSEKVENTSVA